MICFLVSYVCHYSKTLIYRASRGKGFRPNKLRGLVNRIVKYTNIHTNLVFGGRGKVPVNRGDTVNRGPVNRVLLYWDQIITHENGIVANPCLCLVRLLQWSLLVNCSELSFQIPWTPVYACILPYLFVEQL